jgi:hypothetical protein
MISVLSNLRSLTRICLFFVGLVEGHAVSKLRKFFPSHFSKSEIEHSKSEIKKLIISFKQPSP